MLQTQSAQGTTGQVHHHQLLTHLYHQHLQDLHSLSNQQLHHIVTQMQEQGPTCQKPILTPSQPGMNVYKRLDSKWHNFKHHHQITTHGWAPHLHLDHGTNTSRLYNQNLQSTVTEPESTLVLRILRETVAGLKHRNCTQPTRHISTYFSALLTVKTDSFTSDSIIQSSDYYINENENEIAKTAANNYQQRVEWP